MRCGVGLCGHCQIGPTLVCRDGPVYRWTRGRGDSGGEGAVKLAGRPKLAVWKFSSCDGCQLSLLDCEDELLALAGAVEIAYFLEATSARRRRGPTTSRSSRARSRRRTTSSGSTRSGARSRILVSIGACATSGGIQALRNNADVDEFLRYVYASPDYVSTLRNSTAIADHVPVDFELQGCPVSKAQLLEVVAAFLAGRRPNVPRLLRLRRVQAPRHDVRDRLEGRPVPRPGDAGRLRRALPRLRARLLRVLRPEGAAERRRARRAPARAGRRRPAAPRAFRGITGNTREFRKESVLHE